ncbi:hypothetical protein HJC23_009403 [Cyclotella cryptica]|uniref:Sfi1 spindle body domain-containing protein n=1 Tax=Cyclotella cryptica TaxID=29204 RepID=A0ABD3Q356_9STRA
MSRNSNRFDVSWDETSIRKDSLLDGSKASHSRNSLSSSSQSDCVIPPPPPDSDEHSDSVSFSDCCSDCSSNCSESHPSDKSEANAFGDSKAKRYCSENDLHKPANSSSCSSARHCSAILDSSTTKSSIQPYPLSNRTDSRLDFLASSYSDSEDDEYGDCKLGGNEPENSSGCASPDWRPRKAFMNTHASQERETGQWSIRSRLLSLMIVARTFALRCGFDHWKCAGAKTSKHLLLEKSLLSSELARKLFDVLEHTAMKFTTRSAFCILKYRTEQRKHYYDAFQVLSKIFFGAQLRVSFRCWIDKQRRFLAKHSALNNHITTALIKRVKHCFLWWRSHTANKIRRRQACFLMMVFNRWRIYAEERIAENQKRHDALIHWATALCSKAFEIWRSNAQQIKQRIRRTSYSCPDRYFTPLTQAMSKGKPFSISHRSPERSMMLNRTPDAFRSLSGTQTVSQFSVGDRGDASRFTSWMDLQGSYVSRSSANDVMGDHLKTLGHNQTFVTPRTSLSQRAGYDIRSRLSRKDCIATNDGSNHRNTSFLSKYIPLAATQTEMTKPQLNTLFSTDSGLHYVPSCSVRQIRSWYKDRYEISTILDELVARVEESFMWHWYPRRTHRYAAYAGSDEELYHRL